MIGPFANVWRSMLTVAMVTATGVGLHPGIGPAVASTPSQCEVQRLAYCVQGQTMTLQVADDGSATIETAPAIGVRAHRIVEPWSCRRGFADTNGAYPNPSEIRRGADGWIRFTMRLRGDGSCDLQISQLRSPEHSGTRYDRVMYIPIIVCQGEAIASYPGGQMFPQEFTRQGTACSRRY
ncbi:MAG: hypothetical protein QOC65_1110 [Sphingomonadales bacterium]|nr:hypothetical protein [Sphingomonadales bacterium]